MWFESGKGYPGLLEMGIRILLGRSMTTILLESLLPSWVRRGRLTTLVNAAVVGGKGMNTGFNQSSFKSKGNHENMKDSKCAYIHQLLKRLLNLRSPVHLLPALPDLMQGKLKDSQPWKPMQALLCLFFFHQSTSLSTPPTKCATKACHKNLVFPGYYSRR